MLKNELEVYHAISVFRSDRNSLLEINKNPLFSAQSILSIQTKVLFYALHAIAR